MEDEEYETCQHCSRSFFKGRLKLHQLSCKSSKPIKALKKKQVQSPQHTAQSTLKQDLSINDKIYRQASQKDEQMMTFNENITTENINSKFSTKEFKNKNNENTFLDYPTPKTDVDDAQYENEFQIDVNEFQTEQMQDRVECSLCSRKFCADRIIKHEAVCSKQTKQRKVFNTKKQRMAVDAELHQEVKKPEKQIEQKTERQIEKQTEKAQEKKDIPVWKLQHQAFIDTMKYNRKIKKIEKEGGDIRDIEAPQDQYYKNAYVFCQYCQRQFAPKTADRHIPLCKEITNRPKPPKAIKNKDTIKLEKLTFNIKKKDGSFQNNKKDNDSLVRKSNSQDNMKPPVQILKRTNTKINFMKTKLTQIVEKIPQNSEKANQMDIYERSQKHSDIQCENCSRFFSKRAAERHIPICQNIINRPKPLSKNLKNITEKSLSKDQKFKKIPTQRSIPKAPKDYFINDNNLDKNKCKTPIQNQILKNEKFSTKQYEKKQSITINSYCGRCGTFFNQDKQRYCGQCGQQRNKC